MADKWVVRSASQLAKTFKIAGSAAKTKGTPEVIQSLLVFPFDDYASTDDQVFVYACPMVLVTASGANADIASVNFKAGDQLFWDSANSKVTNVGSASGVSFRPIGFCLENKDKSGGVAAGDTLLIEFINASSLRQVGGEVTLDGSNPTSVTTGLTTIIGAQASLKTATAPGDDPSWLSVDYGGGVPAGRLDVHAWKNTGGTDPTLVASTNNTAVISWVAVGI